MPGGVDQQRRVQALRRVVKNARANREARRVVEQVFVFGRGQEIWASYSEPSVELVPVVRAIITEDLITMITGVLQHFQPQQIQQQQSLPSPLAVMTSSVGVQSGGVGSSGLLQPSVAIPDRGYGDRWDIICYYCGG